MLNSKRFRVPAFAAAVATSLCIAAAPASAQTQQNGLVNVAVTDVTVQVPVSVAANVCDVNVAVLATQERTNGATCDATAESMATGGPGGGNGTPGQGGIAQDGLVNVALSDILAQVPISVAANICDLNVGVLAQQLRLGETTCQAGAVSLARTPGAGA